MQDHCFLVSIQKEEYQTTSRNGRKHINIGLDSSANPTVLNVKREKMTSILTADGTVRYQLSYKCKNCKLDTEPWADISLLQKYPSLSLLISLLFFNMQTHYKLPYIFKTCKTTVEIHDTNTQIHNDWYTK